MKHKEEEQLKKISRNNNINTPRNEYIHKDINNENKKDSNYDIEISKNENSEFININDKKISPEDFVAHTVLGKGSFGEV